jgi:hypothetical protein
MAMMASGPSHLILLDEIQSLVLNTSTVIPACPESFPPQRKDSGQAEMPLGFYFFN